MRFARRAVTAAVFFSLGACSTTRFQAPAGTEVSGCDERFVGSWLLTGPGEDSATCEGDCERVVVDAHCSAWHFEEKGRTETDEDRDVMRHVHVGFADIHQRTLLDLRIENDPSDLKDNQAHWPEAHLFLRYAVQGDVIRLYTVDAARVKQLIAGKAIRGWTQKMPIRPRPGTPLSATAAAPSTNTLRPIEGDNYVRGDAQEMARIALLPGVFEESPVALLKRVLPAEIVKPDATAPNP